MEKDIKIIGQISNHQWGIVESRGGQHEPYKQEITSTRKLQSVIIKGAIGNTERQNRDNMRVLGRNGTIYALKSHIAMDHPLVVKKWKSQNKQ